MAVPSYLYLNRCGVYCYQRRVSLALRKAIPGLPTVLRWSLETRIKKEALAKAREYTVMFDIIAQQYFESPEEHAKGIRYLSNFKTARRTHKDNNAEAWQEFKKSLRDGEQLDRDLLSRAIKYSNALIEYKKGAPATRGSSENKITPEMLQEMINEAIKSSPNSLKSSSVNSISLTEATDLFVNDKKINWKVNSDSERTYRQDIFPLFLELLSGLNTGDLDKKHIVEYKSLVLKLPVNRRKVSEYKSLGVRDILDLDIPDEKVISNRTKSKYLTNISSFLNWLSVNGYAESGLADPLKNTIKNKSLASEDRQAYNEEDLKKLFNSKQYLYGNHKQACHFWVPLIALFTGARQNEICQLHIEDIVQESKTKIWVFDFNENNHDITKKSLKRPYHKRQVPIHSTLIQLGFLDYVNQIKKLKHSRIFPELPYDEENKYGETFGKWFNRTYVNARNCDINTEKTSFHSIRHTVINYLVRECGCSENEISHMIGQSPTGNEAATRYLKPADITITKEWIAGLRFDKFIDFKKIRSWKHHDFAKGILNIPDR